MIDMIDMIDMMIGVVNGEVSRSETARARWASKGESGFVGFGGFWLSGERFSQ